MPANDTVHVKIIGDTKDSSKSFLKFAGIVGGATIAIKQIIDVSKVWIKAASDAEEINSKFAVTFDDVSATAAKAAADLAKGYGLAETSAKKLLSNTADLLAGFGATDAEALSLSEKVQKLAVDLASFTNYSGGAEGASEALTKAMLGEREALKSLQIAIGETDVQQRLLEKGQQDLEGEALRLAKAEATLELAYEQSGNALGDLHRTQDSYANVARKSEEVTKALREEMGKRLIPAAGTLQGAILSVKEEMLEMVTATNDLQTALGKEAAGQVLNYTDQVALAEEETIKLRNSMFELASGKLGLDNIRDFVGLLRDGKDGVKEMVEEQEKNKQVIEEQYTIIREAEGIVDGWLQKEREKEDVVARSVELEKSITDEMEKQKAIVEGEYKAAWAEVQSILESNKTESERLTEKIEYLSNFSWPEGHFMEKMKDEAIETLEVEKMILDNEYQQMALLDGGIVLLTEEAAEMWRSFGESMVETTEGMVESVEEITLSLKDHAQVLGGVGKLWGGVGNIISSTYDTQIQKAEGAAQADIDALNTRKLSEQEYADAVKEIETDLDDERKTLLREQAQAAKAFAMFDVGIKTAQAVITAWTNPFPLNIVMSALAAAAGAAQLAAVAAQPIPAAAQGADFVTSGPMPLMVGDNPGGMERVQVTPLSSENVNGPRDSIQNHVYLDGREILNYISRASRDGRFIIDAKVVR